ncbi:MAG: Flp pilus assembly complex ATPase component TadA [Bdellovibrionales bacterium]|nr:Flp pilus assembly complex ATPase component TadA [Bdellovibrionales bacterium]
MPEIEDSPRLGDTHEEPTDPGLSARPGVKAAPPRVVMPASALPFPGSAPPAPTVSPQQRPPLPQSQILPQAQTLPAHHRMPDFGPLAPLMRDPNITEVMINDVRNVMVEKEGRMSYSGLTLSTIDEVNRIVRNVLDVSGRVLSPESPYVDLALADGSRVNIVGPPITTAGPCVTIRKFPRRHTAEELIARGTLSQRMAYFLNACVVSKANILISGGTGSGKTTLMNAMIGLIPKGERIVSIEDTPELLVSQENSVRMQTRPASATSSAITSTHLVANALRMRPDRILIGECRGAEALDMLQAMNTGHEGSMTTIHANTPRDALMRVETLCMMAGYELPIKAIRQQIVRALDLVIQVQRFRSGHRRVTAISELTGMETEMITMQDIFVFEPDPADPTGAKGRFKTLGLVPRILERIHDHGIDIPNNYFG